MLKGVVPVHSYFHYSYASRNNFRPRLFFLPSRSAQLIALIVSLGIASFFVFKHMFNGSHYNTTGLLNC